MSKIKNNHIFKCGKCNEGEIVLDNTMGSGTTGLACLKTNRHFIGIEKEKQYFDVAVRRVSEYCG